MPRKHRRPSTPAKPQRSEAMKAVIEEARRLEREEPRKSDSGFVRKPKAIRRFERYAGRD